MDAAWLVLLGTLGGVVVTFVGNIFLEGARRTAARRDAATDKEAFNLRELQQAIRELSAASADGGAGPAYDRVLNIGERVQVDAIRMQVDEWAGRQIEYARTGNTELIANTANQRSELMAAIASRLRALERLPPTLASRMFGWWRLS
jgi:hypothetical protein